MHGYPVGATPCEAANDESANGGVEAQCIAGQVGQWRWETIRVASEQVGRNRFGAEERAQLQQLFGLRAGEVQAGLGTCQTVATVCS
jgi:hypothetical protein